MMMSTPPANASPTPTRAPVPTSAHSEPMAVSLPAGGLPTAGAADPSSPGANQVPANVTARIEHTVAKGETLYAIARRYGTSVEAVVSANGLTSHDDILSIGRTLIISSAVPRSTSTARSEGSTPTKHTVVKGDTLFAIGRRYGTSVEALVAANGLTSRNDILAIGRTLTIP
jgi:N-acetylmuramoyl-L-alanine amidase